MANNVVSDSVICKKCGGIISIDVSTRILYCNFCGAKQSLKALRDGMVTDCIFDDTYVSAESLDIYVDACQMLQKAKTEADYKKAAQLFSTVPELYDSSGHCDECLAKAELCRNQRLYSAALEDMQCKDVDSLKNALDKLRLLGKFKDSESLHAKCVVLYEAALKEHEKKIITDLHKSKQRKFAGTVFLTVISVVIVMLVYFNINSYSKSYVKFILTPDEDNFLTVKSNAYMFTFDVDIHNTGKRDIDSIECNVILEDCHGNIVIDSAVSFYNYSSPVVRSGKTSSYKWELSVYNEDTALLLYNTDFDDFDLDVEITRMTFSNGKVKTY